jgi:hypothetical protein
MDEIDDLEVQRAVEEAKKNVRCINCIYYPQNPVTLIAYAVCRKLGEVKKFDDYCWDWSNIEWELVEAGDTIKIDKESIMRQEYRVKNLLKAGFTKMSDYGVMVSDTGPLLIKHRDDNFPAYKVTYKSQTDTFNVSMRIGSVESKSIYSLRNQEDAERFLEWYELGLSLKAKRRG